MAPPSPRSLPPAEIAAKTDDRDWEMDETRRRRGRISRPIPADAKSEAEEKGRAIVFRTTVGEPARDV